MKHSLWVVLIMYSNFVFAYNDEVLLFMSTELNKTLPQQKDKYTVLEKTTYSSGVFMYFFNSALKKTDFTKEELAYFKGKHPAILQNRLCGFAEVMYEKEPRLKKALEGTTYQYLTFDSTGILINNIEAPLSSCP